MKYVLSIDGGGIRGLIPALVLKEIESKMGKAISELFDLIVGTSTGGILSLGLTKDDGSGAAKYSAEDLSLIYQKHGEEIFPHSIWKRISSLDGIAGEKYSAKGLEDLLQEYFIEEPLGNALRPVMVTSYDIENREPIFFKSWSDKCASILMKSAARATSAAPIYFEPALIEVRGQKRALIDGAVYINNPAVSAYAEALRLFPNEEITLLSLGTGQLVKPIVYKDAKDWGTVGWLFPILSCAADGVSDAVDYQMKQVLDGNFIRLQTTLTIASDEMDDASPENIKNLMKEAEMLIEANRSIIDSLFS